MFVSVGNSRMDKKFNCVDMSIEDFTKRLSQTTRTAETVEQYKKLPKGQQDNIKDVGGFVLGKLKGGRRKKECVLSRSAVTLDMDYGTENIIDELSIFFDMKMVVYSTHKHTPEKPRLRLIIFLTRDITPDEYGAVSRMIASDIGIELFDDSTYEPSRLMYWPSTSSNGEYVFQEIEGSVVNPDEVLARYKDWRDVSLWPVSNRQTGIVQKNIKKQADPLAKDGLIGAFNRTYTITEAIERFLGDVYKPSSAIPGRYDYIPADSAAGVVVYDDVFMYSHHATDPYIPDESEAVWVRKIYEMAAEGYTPAAIRRYINKAGLKTVQGAEWSDSTVIRLIENEIYKGDYIMHKYFVNDERKLVKNRGEVDAWYIEDDHEAIVSPELWQMAQDAVALKREYLAEGSVIEEFTEENYPYMNKIFCSKCGHPLYKRIYSNGNRLNWGCSGTKRYGRSFCDGINVPDGILRKEWKFDENIYIGEKPNDKGMKEFTYLKEKSWKRRHKKKIPVLDLPENTEENYPYRRKIYCGICGSRLVRYSNTKTNKVTWICNGNKRKGRVFCEGTRVPDQIIKGWGEIKNDIYIQRKDDKNGKKRYSYTSKKPTESK